MKKPEKLDFQVYESVDADPQYKSYKGVVYNDFMYKEALTTFDKIEL